MNEEEISDQRRATLGCLGVVFGLIVALVAILFGPPIMAMLGWVFVE